MSLSIYLIFFAKVHKNPEIVLSFFQNHQKFATLEKTRGAKNHFFDIIGMKKLKSNTQLVNKMVRLGSGA